MNEASDWFNIISQPLCIPLYSHSIFQFTVCFMGGHCMFINNLGFVKSLLQFLPIAEGLLQIEWPYNLLPKPGPFR